VGQRSVTMALSNGHHMHDGFRRPTTVDPKPTCTCSVHFRHFNVCVGYILKDEGLRFVIAWFRCGLDLVDWGCSFLLWSD
jgi:hypothetical protein